MHYILALNKLGRIDKIFFIVIAVLILLCVAIYFLIPVFNKDQYEEARKNLHEREKAFKKNLASDSKKETK